MVDVVVVGVVVVVVVACISTRGIVVFEVVAGVLVQVLF